jgi:hypothetical protein
MVVVLPFLFILGVVGIEITQFFGMREEVQRVVDSEARQSLTRSYGSEYITRRVTSSLQALKPYVEVFDVQTNSNGKRSELVVKGTFNGALNQFVGVLLQQDPVGIPFSISSTVRRAKTIALVVLDRTIQGGEEPCGSENLLIRARMISRLAQGLEASGVERVVVAVMPGLESEIDILNEKDPLPRCGGTRAGYLGIESIEGVSAGSFSDSVAVAYRATQLLLLSSGAGPVEQRAIVMVSPPIEARSESIPTTFSLLEHETARQSAKVSAVGVVVGGDRDANFFQTHSGRESGRARYLHLSEDEANGGDANVALVHHIQGHTFIAR